METPADVDVTTLPVLADASTTLQELVALSPQAFADRLRDLSLDFEGAYAANTLRAWRASWRTWTAFCRRTGATALPATLETLRAFLQERIALGRKRATLELYLATLAAAHRLAGTPWVLDTASGKLMWRSLRRSKPLKKRQRQVDGLTRDLADRLVAAMDLNEPAALRDAALVYVAAETMFRRSELVSIKREQLSIEEDGTGRLVLEESKTDQEGTGVMLALSSEAMSNLLAWLEHAQITAGTLFRTIPRIAKPDEVYGCEAQPGRYRWPLADRDVARIFKRRAAAAGLDPTNIAGHSTRVGATQDLLAANFSGQAIMSQARWKSERMVLRYGEKLNAGRSAMAQFVADRLKNEK